MQIRSRYLLKGLSVEAWPVSECPGHHQRMYVIKRVAEIPGLLQVIDFELDIGRLDKIVNHSIHFPARTFDGFSRRYQTLAAIDIDDQKLLPYYAGCTGDKSTPITCLQSASRIQCSY